MSVLGESKIMEESNGSFSVLIVDDDPNNLSILGQYLKRDGFLVVKASSANEALEILDMMTPDAIMLDYQMPNLNGMEALKIIRSRNQSSVVVMMTAYSAQEVSNEAAFNQADDFLVKPLKFKNIGSLLKKHISQKKSEYLSRISVKDPIVQDMMDEIYSKVLIIRDSTPIYSIGNWDISQTDKEEKSQEVHVTDNVLISGFLTAIHHFSTSVFGENLGEISMGTSQLLLRQVKKNHEYLICLLVSQKLNLWLSKNNLKELITFTLDKILDEFLILEDMISLELNELTPLLSSKIDKIIHEGIADVHTYMR